MFLKFVRRSIHSNNLKIYSFLPKNGGFRLSNGVIKDFNSKNDETNHKSNHNNNINSQSGLVIIGSNHFDWDGSVEGIRAVLKLLRPIPEILVVSAAEVMKDESVKSGIKTDFGCSVEVFEDKIAAASTFNALIDDNRLTIGFFS